MAVAAYFLVVFDADQSDVRRAGLLYVVTTHTGTLLLFALFATWGRDAADFSFASLAAVAPRLPMGGAVVLSIALACFGLKAGLVPLHFWLPEAHAAAPSHISAVMSGVVIKMGIYGLLRVVALFGIVPAWWCWTVLALGVGSGVLGVVWALAQHDIKRLLAFHSVENIGIILIGVGIGGLGLAYHHPVVAMLGFSGALLHTLNHALFKSLLFLGAGSVIHATGVRDLERLGGLSRRMPLTAAAFLVGSVAIVGLPPLNGFVSEWMVYRGALHIGLMTDISRIASLATAVLALIGGLALACFAKVVGVLYLGSPRDPHALAAHESAPGMTWPLLSLAGACACIGLLPVFVLPPILRAAAVVVGADASNSSMISDVASVVDGSAAMAITELALGVTAAVLIGWATHHLLARRLPSKTKAVRLSETWACGYAVPTARMQYTASSFAAPILAHFQQVAGVRTHQTARMFETYPSDPVLHGFVRPLWNALRDISYRARPLQRARLSTYVLCLVAALLALLVYLLVGRWTP
jgi:formate hydrogenlyase subunit 3/multisubunit Na+/H+ antiporter MnhD subunit